MNYLDNVLQETERFEDLRIFKSKYSERNWRHLMKLYRYSNRARGLHSIQDKSSRSCFVPPHKAKTKALRLFPLT